MNLGAIPQISCGESSSSFIFDAEFARMWASKPTSRLAQACQLDIDQVAQTIRQTCIVCTLGDSWSSKDELEKMIRRGMDILVLNMSMTSREKCKRVIEIVRDLEESFNHSPCVAIAMDMTAAPVRTGLFEGSSDLEILMVDGAKVELTTDDAFKTKCTPEKIFIDTTYFPQLIHSVRKGDRIFIDDGTVTLIAKDFGYDSITCLVEEGGSIGGYKRVTLPRERLYQDSVYANYLKDLSFAGECGVDFVFTSYADNATMLDNARQHLPPDTKIFAKIETREGVRNLSELMAHSDGIIIRRGELATQYSSEKIFKLQKHVIGHCNIAEKPVFVMDQLLETMRMKPRPTRAETSDVANAVLDGADGIILTVETSWGKYALESVETVDQICREAERAIFHEAFRSELKMSRELRAHWLNNIAHVTGISAGEAAAICGAKAIFVITTTGSSAISISASRPPCSTIAITRDVKVGRLCHAYRGLHPFVYTGERLEHWSEDMDLRINAAMENAQMLGLIAPKDKVVIVTGTLAGTGCTNTMQIFEVPAEKKMLKVVSSAHELMNSKPTDKSASLPERRGLTRIAKKPQFFGILDLPVPL